MNIVNPLLCDPQTGVCEIPVNQPVDSNMPKSEKSYTDVRMIYFTDPICSACWAIEPQLKKLKLEYGRFFEVEYHLGGLLPSWDGYNGGGIQRPTDVAHHWDEMSDHYQVPIDGNVWISDPLSSSYPPSIAYKAAEMQDKERAAQFMRVLREMVFVQKKNIAKWENILLAAGQTGLDLEKFKQDYEHGAKELFEKDLELSRQSGVRGFPTLIFTNREGKQALVYGMQPYKSFEDALLIVDPSAQKQSYSTDAQTLVEHFGSLMTKELSVLADISFSEAESRLRKLTSEGRIEEITSRKGSLWVAKK